MLRRGFLTGVASVLCTLIVTALPARAQEEPLPIDLQAGDTFEVCASGLILCPARTPICDDPKVAVPVDTPGGLGFKGVGPGTTLCSAASAAGPRRVFRITVR